MLVLHNNDLIPLQHQMPLWSSGSGCLFHPYDFIMIIDCYKCLDKLNYKKYSLEIKTETKNFTSIYFDVKRKKILSVNRLLVS